ALFASTATWLARNDRCSDHSPPPPALSAHRMPERGPDFTDRQRVRPEQAALYRLLGDRNPLHIDPAAAAAGGFGEPVLHGLCTSGIACRSVLKTVCNYDPTLIKSLSQRFTAPVVAHDELLTEMWQDGAVISFRVSAVQRDTIVVDNGCAVLME
ncbi:MAG: MaoC family dehydratase, partial [Pseudomonadota bacterium]